MSSRLFNTIPTVVPIALVNLYCVSRSSETNLQRSLPSNRAFLELKFAPLVYAPLNDCKVAVRGFDPAVCSRAFVMRTCGDVVMVIMSGLYFDLDSSAIMQLYCIDIIIHLSCLLEEQPVAETFFHPREPSRLLPHLGIPL